MKSGQRPWGKMILWILPGPRRERQPAVARRIVAPHTRVVRQVPVMFTPSGGPWGEAASCSCGAGKVGAAQVRDFDRGMSDELDH
jgi:hypothetical protein